MADPSVTTSPTEGPLGENQGSRSIDERVKVLESILINAGSTLTSVSGNVFNVTERGGTTVTDAPATGTTCRGCTFSGEAWHDLFLLLETSAKPWLYFCIYSGGVSGSNCLA